jgi:putative nucleotidyltransferase with HDIG domain
MDQQLPNHPSANPSELQIADRDLPALPVAALRTLRLLQDPSLTNGCFARLIQHDGEVSLSERILRVANSSYYALRTPIRNVVDAISRLGRRQMYDLVVVAAVGKLYDSTDPYGQRLWNHAIATGIASHALAERYHALPIDEAFLAGVLHDIGKLIVYKKYPDLYPRHWSEAGMIPRRLDEVEAAEFPDLAHSSVGSRAIRKWNLSSMIADTAQLHHRLEHEIPVNLPEIALPCVVSLASVIVNNLGLDIPVCSWPETVSLACARRLKFEMDHVEPIYARLSEVFDIHHENFSSNPNPNPKVDMVTIL